MCNSRRRVIAEQHAMSTLTKEEAQRQKVRYIPIADIPLGGSHVG